MPLALGVIGLGRMGRFYARTVHASLSSARLVAAADPKPAARASVRAELGCTVFADPLAVVERPDVEAVLVASPASTHAEIVIAAAAAGKHILCEKPLALTMDQTKDVLAAVERAGIIFQVGFMRRFDSLYSDAKAAIEAGCIGRVVSFKAIGRDPDCPPLAYANPAYSGGLILDMALHDFDLARWLMSSEVERVSTEAGLLVCEQLAAVDDIDNAVINLRFANGALGNVEVSRNARYGYDVRTEVLGSHGAVMVGNAGWGRMELLNRAADSPADGTPHFVERFGSAYRLQLEHFFDCVKRNLQPAVGGIDALAAFKIAQAATMSWKSARPVALAELEISASV